jgi:hypothetical protein
MAPTGARQNDSKESCDTKAGAQSARTREQRLCLTGRMGENGGTWEDFTVANSVYDSQRLSLGVYRNPQSRCSAAVRQVG